MLHDEIDINIHCLMKPVATAIAAVAVHLALSYL